MKVLNGVDTAHQVEFYVVIPLVSVMIMLLAGTMVSIWRTSKYPWLLQMLLLLILADIAIILTVMGYVFQLNPVFLFNHLLFDKFAAGLGSGLYPLFLGIFHWLFAFEYWEASMVEFPICSERFITVFKWSGIVVNVLMCGWVAWE